MPDLVKPGSFMATNDLDSGYWHIAVRKEHWTYLGIHVTETDGSNSFYVWVVMFLGVSDAVFIFTTMLKLIRCYLASKGVPNCIYIDDLMVLGRCLEDCVANNAFALEVLAKAGWVVSPSKATGPADRLTFLGLDVCSRSMMFFIPEKKLEAILGHLDSFVKGKKTSPRCLARLVGKIQSCHRALGPVVRHMTRNIYRFICSNVENFAWDYFLPIDSEVRDELLFWKNNLRTLDGFHFSPVQTEEVVNFEVASDASGVGVFAYLVDSNRQLLSRPFNLDERSGSST